MHHRHAAPAGHRTFATRLAGFLLLAGLLSATPARAADSFTPAQRAEIVRVLREALVKDPSILKDAIDALQVSEKREQDDSAHAALVANRSALADPADPVAGNPKGDVTIVEFFDVRCPYCKRLDPTMAELLKRDPQVRLVYKDLPVLGPASVLGARALLAAQRQGGYEKLREVLMRTDAPGVTKESLQADAQKLGLDWAKMSQDMDSPEIEARIQKNLKLATSLGIQGTPAMVIGDALIPGAVDLAELQRAVADTRNPSAVADTRKQ